ncbi:Proline-rich receptor-like protein kinase PERK8 [Morus notabilis]|uniref:non-specific serine/threonine protein kinase n=1 Tax=Morus notabilis TaxID=981085 RepID=W9R6S0_9ROSA|nr:Proline-rich receptor-like protein kinase PERK8 [Morus notabilis]
MSTVQTVITRHSPMKYQEIIISCRLVWGFFNGVMLVYNALVLVATASAAHTDSALRAQQNKPQAKILNPSPFSTGAFPSHSSIHLQERIYKSAAANGDSGVPTLTTEQEEGGHDYKRPKKKVAAIIGGAVAALLVVVVVFLVYICLMRVKKLIRRTSESASSVPSSPVEWERGGTSPYAVALSPFDTQNLRELSILEVEQATCNFSQNNIIGEGRFGLAYKGMLQDGSIVAIKRRLQTPTRSFFHQVKQIARVQHVHLVKLIGFYYDSYQHLLIYDYLLNGNVGNHLYDSEGLPIGKLGIRHRVSIALGAAKGLGHLHSLVPPQLHLNFRTRNVLLDETFMAKVSDYGLSKLLIEGNHAGSSSAIDCFLDPELDMPKNVSDRSDVYSFGVFLLELISGRGANVRNRSNSGENLVLQAKQTEDFEEFVDKSLGRQATGAAKQMMELALMCIDGSARRPPVKFVVEELERIQEGENARLSSELDLQIGAVTLGSELFR